MTMLACGTWETGTPGNRKFNIDFCWDFHQNQKMVCEWQRCTCPSPAAIPSGICNPPRTCLPWIPLCPVCQAIYTPLLNCHRGNVGWLGHWQTILLCPFSPAPVHQLLGHDLCCSPNLQCHNSQDLLLIHHHPSFLRSSVWLSVSLPSPRKLCCCASLQYATLSLYCAGRQFFSGVCFCSMSPHCSFHQSFAFCNSSSRISRQVSPFLYFPHENLLSAAGLISQWHQWQNSWGMVFSFLQHVISLDILQHAVFLDKLQHVASFPLAHLLLVKGGGHWAIELGRPGYGDQS